MDIYLGSNTPFLVPLSERLHSTVSASLGADGQPEVRVSLGSEAAATWWRLSGPSQAADVHNHGSHSRCCSSNRHCQSFPVSHLIFGIQQVTPLSRSHRVPIMESQIREVWADNLDVEMAKLRSAVERYPYVAMVSRRRRRRRL